MNPGMMGTPKPPPTPLLLLGITCEIDRENERSTVYRGGLVDYRVTSEDRFLRRMTKG